MTRAVRPPKRLAAVRVLAFSRYAQWLGRALLSPPWIFINSHVISDKLLFTCV